MTQARLQETVQHAIEAGLIPPDATAEFPENRPWPVVVLTAVGAWIAAIPLLIVMGVLFGEFIIKNGEGALVVGTFVLWGAIAILRAHQVALFAEQLAIPVLIVGACILGFGLFDLLPETLAAVLLALSAAAVTLAVPMVWLRVILGGSSACFSGIACYCLLGQFGLSLHLMLFVWLTLLLLQGRGLQPSQRAACESFAQGWVLLTLAGFVYWSGMTFLVGASFGEAFGFGMQGRDKDLLVYQWISAVIALLACVYLLKRCPKICQPWTMGVLLVMLVLAWWMPALGGVLVVLIFAVLGRRWGIASSAGLAGAWVIGAFYYQLNWPLAQKAALLIGAGLALAVLAYLSIRPKNNVDVITEPVSLTQSLKMNAGIVLSAVGVLLAVNFGIWEKQQFIERGQVVFVALAPVDPRSLMQGDFMTLNYQMPSAVTTELDAFSQKGRPYVVAHLDAQRVATMLRVNQRSPLAKNEIRIEMVPKNGGWVLVSDAWFFKEGEGARWSAAKYAEFRVNEQGRALLVGLRGANLQPL